jgi:hypothetical protein
MACALLCAAILGLPQSRDGAQATAPQAQGLLPVLHDMLLEGHIERHRPFYFSYAARLAACHQYMDSALRAQCKADAQMIQQAEAAARGLLAALPANSPEVRQGRVTFLFDRQLMALPETERQQNPWWPVLENLLSDYKASTAFAVVMITTARC